jgi:uncharacterized membrane protein
VSRTRGSHAAAAGGEARTVRQLLQTNVEAIHRLDVRSLHPQSLTDRIAARVERFAGSPTFIWLHVAWFAAWIIANTVLPTRHFDPFPFTFLTLVVSLEAIFLAAFILMSQNVSASLSERRNQLDLQINLLAEQENTKMLKILVAIGKHLDVPNIEDADVRLFEQATRPDQLARQIERSQKKDEQKREQDQQGRQDRKPPASRRK